MVYAVPFANNQSAEQFVEAATPGVNLFAKFN